MRENWKHFSDLSKKDVCLALYLSCFLFSLSLSFSLSFFPSFTCFLSTFPSDSPSSFLCLFFLSRLLFLYLTFLLSLCLSFLLASVKQQNCGLQLTLEIKKKKGLLTSVLSKRSIGCLLHNHKSRPVLQLKI